MEIFINNGVHNGIQNYLDSNNNLEINKVHIYEYLVTCVLVSIYGEINIVNPFKLRKAESFKKNLLLYGTKEKEVESLFNYMNDYYNWLNSSTLVNKTNIPNEINKILINMIIAKKSHVIISEKELEFYDSFFDPISGDMLKIQNLIIDDKITVPNLWYRKKSNFENKLILEKILPDLLPTSFYDRYGFSIEEIKQLSNLKIKEINDKIMSEELEENNGGKGKIDPKKLILTSGSGFVDTVVLLSIMATEIMIGLLIAFWFLRR